MDYNIIIRPVLGAVIGYSTNWLAIKMLFKPHTEKRIGKFRVPFTPGLIPRERTRIAKSLGTAVGERLLTEEVISKELLNPNVIGHIKKFVTVDLLGEDIAIKDIMLKIFGDEYAIILRKISKGIVAELEVKLDSEELKETLRGQVKDYMAGQLPYNVVLEDIVPAKILDDLEYVLYNHKDQISEFIVLQTQTEAMKEKLSSMISALVMEKVGALGAMFLNPADISESILEYVKKTLFEEEVQKALIQTVKKGSETLLSQELSEILALGQYEGVIDTVTNQVSNGVMSVLGQVDMISWIEPMIEGLMSKKIRLSSHEKEQIELKIEDQYRAFVSGNIGTFLKTFEVSKIVESEVNNFSVMDIEQLIFAIVDKELNAITWFGALLGFIMGMVYIVI